MLSRRKFLSALSAFPLSGMAGRGIFEKLPFLSSAEPRASASDEDLTKFVKIAIGTGGHGHTYPGATVPFGMVQLSPDTFNDGWDWCSGYHYSDSSIMGFSHTHLSGTGASDMLDFLLMPGTGPSKIFPGSRQNPGEGYRSRFSHEEEIAEPGYYSVILRDYDIRVELSATERAGIHRYTFPQGDSSHFILDLFHGYGSAPILWADLKILATTRLWAGAA
jgi:putative alpha-1,2-mannosidase